MISLFFQLRWGKTAPFTGRERDELLALQRRAYQQNVNGMDAVSGCRQKAILPLGENSPFCK